MTKRKTHCGSSATSQGSRILPKRSPSETSSIKDGINHIVSTLARIHASMRLGTSSAPVAAMCHLVAVAYIMYEVHTCIGTYMTIMYEVHT